MNFQEFMEMTGTKDQGLAEFYMSSADGDVNKAVDIYFESVKGTSKIATLSGNSKSQNPNTFFAGGDKSGVLIQGKPDKDDVVQEILKLASESKPFEEEAGAGSSSQFKGTGFKLGASNQDSRDSKINLDKQDEIASRTLTFWKNGFSIDDGPLRDFNDPENEAFLNAIKNGMAPLQYLNLKPGQKVELKIAHRSDQDFEPPPKAPMKAFSGSGQRLGSIIPGTVYTNNQSSSAPEKPANIKFQVRQDESVTSVQIRLGDGTRLVLKCNHSHTIRDVRDFIIASSPIESSRSWILQTVHPVKVLENLDQTIKEAGLLNSVIIQKYSNV